MLPQPAATADRNGDATEDQVSAKAGSLLVQANDTRASVPDMLIAAFEDVNTAVALFDMAGMTLYTNKDMHALAGAMGRPISGLSDLAPEDADSAAAIDFEQFRTGRIDRMRALYVIHGKTGMPFWADLSASRKVFAPGQPPLILVQIVDATFQHEAAHEIERINTRWETALEAGRQGVWENDSRSGVVTYSRMWRRMR